MLLRLLSLIIENSDTSQGLALGKGLPIGNLTRQFLANVYLDPFDHFLKDEKGLRYYIRYMDDMVVFSDSRDELKTVLCDIRMFLSARLSLRLKDKATVINSRAHGLPFLGFRVFVNLFRIKAENLSRMKRRIKEKAWRMRRGGIEPRSFVEGVRSMIAHASFAGAGVVRKAVAPEAYRRLGA